jgi:NAD-dependent deacetylase
MPHTESIKKAADLLRNAKKAVAFTGAGHSTRSGIPDFRSPDSGVWENVDPLEVATIQSFVRKPEAFYNWMRPMAKTMRDAKPNPAHVALAQMEKAGYLSAIITQNIDTLHTRAGSHEVYEVHGNMRAATCIQCYEEYEAAPYIDKLIENGDIPHCPSCGGVLKPNVVLFGEQLPARVLLASERAARTCDVMLIAGSSLVVTPAADLPRLALSQGAHIIIVNYDNTYVDSRADVVIHDDVAKILPMIATEIGVAGG